MPVQQCKPCILDKIQQAKHSATRVKHSMVRVLVFFVGSTHPKASSSKLQTQLGVLVSDSITIYSPSPREGTKQVLPTKVVASTQVCSTVHTAVGRMAEQTWTDKGGNL